MSDPALLLLFVIGLAVGSFLNVVIYRLPRRESLAWPSSRCPACRRSLAWFENVPLASWLALRGRCRTCRAPISFVYPAVELLTAIVFAGSYLVYGSTLLLPVRLLFACAMIALFFIDLRHQILPNAITVPGIMVGFAASFALPPGWVSSLLGAAIGGGMLWLIAEAYYRVRGQHGLGMGDVKMLAMVGAFLGWRLTLMTLLLASLAGSLVGIGVIASGRGGMTYALPFGTFIAVGALVASLAGPDLLAWYLSLFP